MKIVFGVLICWPVAAALFLMGVLIGAFAIGTAPFGLILLVPAVVAFMCGVAMLGMPFIDDRSK